MDTSYVAVIDIGSNSIKSLVAKRGNPIEVIHQGLHETRISSGISQARPALTDTAMQAGTESVACLYQDIRQWPCQTTAMVATSAVRDAVNGADFAERIRQATGQPLTILSGEQEAQLIGRGLSADPTLHGFDAFSHLDLGGGSLECMNYRHGTLTQAISLQLGAVRLTEQLIDAPHQPMPVPLPDLVDEVVRKTVRKQGVVFTPGNDFLVGTGGAFTVTRAIFQHQSRYLDGIMPCAALKELYTRLANQTLEERIRLPGLPAQRADILPVALLTLLTIARLAGAERFIHSYYNLRYGLALELLEKFSGK